MSLNISEQPITDQLSQFIKKMRDFLLDGPSPNNFSDKEQYKNLYNKINMLTVKVTTEGWFDYKHNNPYKTLADFLDKSSAADLILKYYSLPPSWKRVLIKQPKLTKVIKGGKKLIEFGADIVGRIIRPR